MKQRFIISAQGTRCQCIVGALLLCLFAGGLVESGCATRPKINWAARVGSYTYDEAVLEMGPPDKFADLTDGTKVCEWLTTRGYSRGRMDYIPGFGPQYIAEPSSPDYFIRLTFAPDRKLKEWKSIVH